MPPSDAEIPVSVFPYPLECLVTPAECMQAAPDMEMGAVVHDAEEIFGGLAQVDVDRQVHLSREFHLNAESLALLGRELGAVMVVKPDLSQRDDLASAVAEHGVDLVAPSLVHRSGIAIMVSPKMMATIAAAPVK